MNVMNRIDRHASLVGQMAETVGADMGHALVAGSLDAEAVRVAVLRCMRCDSVKECGDWLDAHAESGAESPPAYCRNHDLLARLIG